MTDDAGGPEKRARITIVFDDGPAAPGECQHRWMDACAGAHVPSARLCRRHYNRSRATVRALDGCSWTDGPATCESSVKTGGLCRRHYALKRRSASRPATESECRVCHRSLARVSAGTVKELMRDARAADCIGKVFAERSSTFLDDDDDDVCDARLIMCPMHARAAISLSKTTQTFQVPQARMFTSLSSSSSSTTTTTTSSSSSLVGLPNQFGLPPTGHPLAAWSWANPVPMGSLGRNDGGTESLDRPSCDSSIGAAPA